MKLLKCVLCNKKKTSLRCDACGDVSCKNCVQFIDEDHFEMIAILPDDLKNKTFCLNCYNQGIDEKVNHYSNLIVDAKNVDVFTTSQTKETRRIKRLEAPIKIVDCDDKSEALIRLAFLTAQKGFNTIVDVELNSKKIGEGKSYKKLVWTAKGIPVDPSLKK